MSGDNKSGPSAMEGGGFYNRNSALQAAGIARLLPFWETACRTVEIGAESLVIVDYGSSQGRNSMAPMRMAIEELRRRTGTDTPIEVIHTDLPANDFSSLFIALQDEPNSYLSGTSNVFPSAIGRSYFEPLLPLRRVHLGWNTFTMHWMSGSPADAPDHVIAGLSKSSEVSRAVIEQQAIEWRRFLEMRSREMREGAKLLSAFACRTKNGTGWEWLCGELWAAILDMGKAGLLSKEDQSRITIPVGWRTLEEIKTPFSSNGYFADLELERAEFFRILDPFWDEFQSSRNGRQFGLRHADLTRAWAGPAISDRIAPGRDRAALVDDLFARLAARISAAPKKHEPYLAVVVLKKNRA